MKILLLGEYSNLHHTLSEALRAQGHEVLLISDGDGWKNYPRDIDLSRKKAGLWGSMLYMAELLRLLPRMKGYDVVQLINPVFLHLKPRWNRWVFQYLRRHNRKISLGLFGDDYYVFTRSQDSRYFCYTDFFAQGKNIDHAVNRKRLAEWTHPSRAQLNQYIALQSDLLIACLYEYYHVYDTPDFKSRLHYAALPIVPLPEIHPRDFSEPKRKIKILMGIQKDRSAVKGTDRMLPIFRKLADRHPEEISLTLVESVPFEQYRRLLAETDILVDQLYSYTPAMNALEAMRNGTIVVSGGEEEAYDFIGEKELRPIINLRPGEDEYNYTLLENTILDRTRLTKMSEESIAYVCKHHDADNVAQKYIDIFGQELLKILP